MRRRSLRPLPTILIVDDLPEVRTALRRLVERAGGFSVAEAADAEEARALAEEARPDVAILDISMPGKPGFTLIPLLRAAGTRTLVLSGHGDMKEETLAMGADAFLPKSAPPRRVLSTLSALLQ